MEIFTTYYHSPLGEIEISATIANITSLMFKDAEKKPSPSLMPSGSVPEIIENAITQLNEYFTGIRKTFELPFSQDGTDFQQTVWNELIHIPFGETISYEELAIRLGDKNKIRAAASANGLNKLNIIIPCHRVIGKYGKLVGYGGDLWRKKWLINHEFEFSEKKGHLF